MIRAGSDLLLIDFSPASDILGNKSKEVYGIFHDKSKKKTKYGTKHFVGLLY